jgi:CRP/FNR family transcriptional regulator, cyclic AMP receptor protein
VAIGPSIIPPSARSLEEAERQAILADMGEIIASSHLFKSLDDAGRARVLESGYVSSYVTGDVIIKQDDAGDTMFLVLKGSVHVQTDTPGGTIHLAELGRGACFGEVSLLTEGPRTATVTAVTDVDCVTFVRHRIERVLEDYPRVRVMLEAIIEGRARDTIEKIVKW